MPAQTNEKRLALMQPYFLPYLGYWQLMQAVDEFVIYDDVQFSKGGWINRNRLLINGDAKVFTLPLLKGNLRDRINERVLSDGWSKAREGLSNKIDNAYSKAPFYPQVLPMVQRILTAEETNLADFICRSVIQVRAYLGIETPLLRSSELKLAAGSGAADRVLSICKARGAGIYINAPGGRSLYDRAEFRAAGVELQFIQPEVVSYSQFSGSFVPNLSILDVMMFNAPADIRDMLERYSLD